MTKIPSVILLTEEYKFMTNAGKKSNKQRCKGYFF